MAAAKALQGLTITATTQAAACSEGKMLKRKTFGLVMERASGSDVAPDIVMWTDVKQEKGIRVKLDECGRVKYIVEHFSTAESFKHATMLAIDLPVPMDKEKGSFRSEMPQWIRHLLRQWQLQLYRGPLPAAEKSKSTSSQCIVCTAAREHGVELAVEHDSLWGCTSCTACLHESCGNWLSEAWTKHSWSASCCASCPVCVQTTFAGDKLLSKSASNLDGVSVEPAEVASAASSSAAPTLVDSTDALPETISYPSCV